MRIGSWGLKGRPKGRKWFVLGEKYIFRICDWRRVYNQRVEKDGYFTEEFVAAIIAAGHRARLETLAAGVPVSTWTMRRISILWNIRMGANSKYASSPALRATAITG